MTTTIRTLDDYTGWLRRLKPGCSVPDFDPDGPREQARVLFLLARPGPRGADRPVSLFSEGDPTTRNMREIMAEAEIDPREVLLWSVVPWHEGRGAVTAAERRDGLAVLPRLLALLPRLKAVVLVGNDAQKALPQIRRMGVRVFRSPHPSPLVRNANLQKYLQIAPVWRRAGEVAAALRAPSGW